MLTNVYLAGLIIGTAAAGVAAHELSHAITLWLAGISGTVEVLPSSGDAGRLSRVIRAPLARVRPIQPGDDIPTGYLRAAALMPLCLAFPLVLIFVGILPDPFASDALGPKLALIVWLGCSIPSPQDFSLACYPERALAMARDA